MLKINKVLVATDFSEASAAALDHARDLCRQFHAELVLLHVVETKGFSNIVASSGYAALVPDLFQEILDGERAHLDSLITDEDRSTFHAKTVMRTTGRPASEVVNFAAEVSVDLIVMGTHGRRGLSHLVLGSVAEEVVRTARCPVLTVRPSRHGTAFAETSDRVAAVDTPA